MASTGKAIILCDMSLKTFEVGEVRVSPQVALLAWSYSAHHSNELHTMNRVYYEHSWLAADTPTPNTPTRQVVHQVVTVWHSDYRTIMTKEVSNRIHVWKKRSEFEVWSSRLSRIEGVSQIKNLPSILLRNSSSCLRAWWYMPPPA